MTLNAVLKVPPEDLVKFYDILVSNQFGLVLVPDQFKLWSIAV